MHAEAERLVAEGRDEILRWYRAHMPNAKEAEQKHIAAQAVLFMQSVIHRTVNVVAAAEYPHIPVQLVDASMKGKISLTFDGHADNIAALASRKGATVLLVLTNPAQFDTDRGEPDILPDEPALDLKDTQAPDEPTPALDDMLAAPVEIEEPASFAEPAPRTTIEAKKPLAYHAGEDAYRAGLSMDEGPDWVKANDTLAREFKIGWQYARDDARRADVAGG